MNPLVTRSTGDMHYLPCDKKPLSRHYGMYDHPYDKRLLGDMHYPPCDKRLPCDMHLLCDKKPL